MRLMENQLYQIVFAGQVIPGVEVAKVQAKLAALFRCESSRIVPLFAGQPRVLKRSLSLQAARDFQAAMQNAGALCEVVPMAGEADAAAAVKPAAPVRQQPSAGQQVQRAARTERPPAEGARSVNLRRLKAQAAGVAEKMRSLNKADLQHKLTDLKERIRETDAEEAGRLVGAKVTALAGRLAAAQGQQGVRGLLKSRGAKILLGAGVVVAALIVLTIFHENPPMPTDAGTLARFAAAFDQKLLTIDVGRSRAITGVTLAQEIISDMGYDYGKTIRLWLLSPGLREGSNGELLYARYLVGPVRDLTAVNPRKAAELVDETTLRIIRAQLEIPEGVTPLMLAMLEECPREGLRLKHGDLLGVLQAHQIPIDAAHPDLAIQQAFAPLARSGLIHMQTSGAWGKETMDVEIRDPDRIAKVAETFKFIETMRDKYLGGETAAQKP
jgi:hypothetical protein